MRALPPFGSPRSQGNDRPLCFDSKQSNFLKTFRLRLAQSLPWKSPPAFAILRKRHYCHRARRRGHLLPDSQGAGPGTAARRRHHSPGPGGAASHYSRLPPAPHPVCRRRGSAQTTYARPPRSRSRGRSPGLPETPSRGRGGLGGSGHLERSPPAWHVAIGGSWSKESPRQAQSSTVQQTRTSGSAARAGASRWAQPQTPRAATLGPGLQRGGCVRGFLTRPLPGQRQPEGAKVTSLQRAPASGAPSWTPAGSHRHPQTQLQTRAALARSSSPHPRQEPTPRI